VLLLLMMWLRCGLFQHISLLEEKVAELESWKLHHSIERDQLGADVDDIQHLEQQLNRAEAELAHMDNVRRSSQLQENHTVSSFVCFS